MYFIFDYFSMTFVLDNIRSGWNVGSVFRTADSLGADVILVGYTPRPIGKNLAVIKKTAIGAENTVDWEDFSHFQEVFEKYPHKNHFAIEISDSSTDIFEYIKNSDNKNLIQDAFFWFGNEIHGVSTDLQNRCLEVLHLPMKGQKESLNIANSVAATGYLVAFAARLV